MVQTIASVLRQERRTQPGLSPNLKRKSDEIVQAFGNRENFLRAFNPDAQKDVCANTDECFFGGSPSLGMLNVTYGDNTAVMWLIPELYNLSEYCGCRDKLEGTPLKECARVIAMEFHYLKVTEVMLFFHRFKSGRYGRFYGSVDPLVITTSLRDFLAEREYAYNARMQQEQRLAAERDKQNAVSYEEYLATKNDRTE